MTKTLFECYNHSNSNLNILREMWHNPNLIDSFSIDKKTKDLWHNFHYSIINNKPAIYKGISGVAELPKPF